MTSLEEFYKNKQVTVLGGTGLIGSYMILELKKLGAHVRAVKFMRPSNEFTRIADELSAANLTNLEDAKSAVRGSEIVMNCAGITGGVGLAINDPTSFVGPNAVLGAQILEACYREKVARVGHLSSTVVYPPSDKPVSEDDLNFGIEPYPLYFGIGWMKRFLEKLCQYYYEKVGLKIGIIRPSGAYGRYDNFDEKTSHVLPGLIARAFREREQFVVWGNGKDVRDIVHASDVARGLLKAVMIYPYADPINIASNRPITTLELAKMVLNAVGSNATIELDETKPTALPTRMVDITKAKAILGYAPQITLEDGIKDTVEWYRKQVK